jgi:hypothetical protein
MIPHQVALEPGLALPVLMIVIFSLQNYPVMVPMIVRVVKCAVFKTTQPGHRQFVCRRRNVWTMLEGQLLQEERCVTLIHQSVHPEKPVSPFTSPHAGKEKSTPVSQIELDAILF